MTDVGSPVAFEKGRNDGVPAGPPRRRIRIARYTEPNGPCRVKNAPCICASGRPTLGRSAASPGGVRDDDPASLDFLFLEPLEEHSVIQRVNFHKNLLWDT